MEDDVTIEDEFEQMIDHTEIPKQSTFDQILNRQWIIYFFFISTIVIGILFYLKRSRRRNVLSSTNNSSHVINRYEEMDRIRQRQQKLYEEQTLRYNEEKKIKMDLIKSKKESEKNTEVKYRSNDYNPLTGQSSNSSCSWRPSSSSRRKAPGG